MDDPYAVLRIPAMSVRKEKDLPKLKERAIHLVKEYEKANKHNKAREVEKAYRQVKELVMKQVSSAGARAFSKVMVNRPAKKGEPSRSQAAKPSNPAEAHFMKAQGAKKAPAAASAGPAPEPAQCAEPQKSREERLREKLEARRQAAKAGESESAKRAAAIREKLAAKRAKTNPPAEGCMPSPDDSTASPMENMASPETDEGDPAAAAENDGAEQGAADAGGEEPTAEAAEEQESEEGQGEPEEDEEDGTATAEVDFF